VTADQLSPDPEAFAELICDWCLEVRATQQVLVTGTTLADAPARALHRALLERGAWPLLRLSPPWATADFFRYARPEQLDGFASAEFAQAEAIDARVSIDAPANTQALAAIDPGVVQRAMRGRLPLHEKLLAGRWCGTIWPTPALAQQARMSDEEYAAFVTKALFLDRPDPVAAWGELSARQARVVDSLAAADVIRIEAEGTDLTLRVGGRTWINSDGRRNMPSGEVFTGPHEDSADGTIRFDVPSNVRGGSEVVGVEVRFERGRVVAARADQGDEYLQSALQTDRGARFLGELGIGTNTGIDRATGATLLDEKIAGTVHLALGRSYPETGGTNTSALHWDLICDLRHEGRLTADGEPIVEDGELLIT
jgi:aminopeptidase